MFSKTSTTRPGQRLGRSSVACALWICVSSAAAQTVTVTTSSNAIDIDFFVGTVADLPGPDGQVSFLEALVATNHTPGHQTIAFNIPQNDWGLQFLYPGCAVITAGPNGFIATDSVTIDGTTQTAFTGDTNASGGEVALYFPFGTLGASLGGEGSRLTGFHSGEWWVSGDQSEVVGNSGDIHINVSGDGCLVRDNDAGTIKIDGGSDTVVVASTMQRVRIWGGSRNRVGGPALEERNFITGYGTTNSEGLPAGTDVELWATQDTVVQNNYIGTAPDGMTQGNQFQTIGIEVDTGNHGLRVIDNLIAGVLGHGQGPHWAGTLWGWAVYFSGQGSDVEFSGNTIGLDAAGEATLPSMWGIHTGGSNYSDVRFLGNVVAGHYFNGVTIGNSASAFRLGGNSIYANAWSGSGFLGIDLLGPSQATGITANDPLDADTGGNDLQNFPVLASATLEGATTRVTGTLDSTPGSSYTIEVFASPSCDASGHGQGQLVLGALNVLTDGSGHPPFEGVFPASPQGWSVSATATAEPQGATSEFSTCVETAPPICAQDLGFAGPGGSSLSVCGSLAGAGTAFLGLDGSAPASPTWLIFGTTYSPTSMLGGTVVPMPGQVAYLGTPDSSGALSVGPVTGGGGPVTLYAQTVYLDEGQIGLAGLSNAVEVELLP